MNKAVLVSAMGVIGLAAAGAASAQEIGRVISSTPVVQQVAVQRQVCNQQPVAMQQQPSSGAGAVIGAIAGGLIGHTVGGGMGNAVATGLGVVAGAAVGDNMSRRDQYYAQGPGQCTTQTAYENRTVGYNVQYEYGGRNFTVQMPYDPGPTVRLQVTPMGSSSAPAQGSQIQALAGDSGVQQQQQPVYVAQAPTVVYPAYAYPAYTAYGYPGYYPRPYYYPPVSLSFGYMWHGGGRRWH